MSLGRVWAKQLCRASGAALLAPAGVLAALAVLGLSGGFGSLGALGEAFSGPSLAGGLGASGLSTASSGHPGSTAVVLARAILPGAGSGPGTRSFGSSGAGAPPPHTSPPPARTAPRAGGATPGGGSGPTSNPGGGSGPTSNPGGHGRPVTGPRPPGPTGHPTLIDGVVSLGTSVTSRVPGPVGSLATGTLKSVGHTLDGVLGGSSGDSRSARRELWQG